MFAASDLSTPGDEPNALLQLEGGSSPSRRNKTGGGGICKNEPIEYYSES